MNNNNEYSECFEITFFISKLLAITPFIFSHQGTSISLLRSRAMTVFSITLYLFVLPQQLIFMSGHLKTILNNFDYNLLIRISPTITIRLVLFAMPFITWNKSKSLHNYLDSWKKFQTEIESLTGTKLSLSTRNRIRWIPAFLLFFVNMLSATMQSFYHKNVNVTPSYPSLMYTMSTMYFVSGYWYANCLFVRSVGEELQQVIKNAIRNKEERNLRKAMDLWLKLCDLNEQFDTIHSTFFYAVMSSMIVNMVASFYSFLFVVIYETNKLTGVSHILYTTFMVLAVGAFCESSYFVVKSVVFHVNDMVLNQNTINVDAKLLRTMIAFLQLIETRKPKIAFSKIMILNRSAIVSIFAAAMNYLIVMKQFATMKYQ